MASVNRTINPQNPIALVSYLFILYAKRLGKVLAMSRLNRETVLIFI